jgi:hypothetical protein
MRPDLAHAAAAIYVVVATVATATPAVSADRYVLSVEGGTCTAACAAEGLHCNWHLETHDSPQLFEKAGIHCNRTMQGGHWWAEDQPSYVAGLADPNHGDCLGYVNVPPCVECEGHYASVQRLCRCSASPSPPQPPNCGSPPPPKPDPTVCWFTPGGTKPCWDDDTSPPGSLTFGTGLSGGSFGGWEKTLFAHRITKGHTGVMNHFWSTCNAACEGNLIVRYYIDGEQNASIEFEPGLASGSGFDDQAAPWGTKWMGHGAHSAWFNNFKIPFGDSVRVTIQSKDGAKHGGFYMILRGGLDLPLTIGDITLPPTARLQLQKYEGPLEPLEWLSVAKVPKGYAGQFFMSTLAVNNSGVGGLNFLEGCYHMYDPPDQPFP